MDNKKIKKAAVAGLGYRFAERILAQIVSTLISILLARILAPAEYGLIAIITSLITIFNVFVESGLGVSLIQKKEVDRKDFSTVFWASIILSVVMYAILFAGAPLFANIYRNAAIIPILRVMGLRLPLAAINCVQHAYVSKQLMFRKFFYSTLAGTVVSGIIGVVLAYIGYGVWALVFQYLANTFIGTVILWITVRWRPQLFFSWERFLTLFSFGWKILVSGLLTAVYEEIRSFIIAGKYTAEDLSFYSKGQQFPRLIVNNVGTTITNVMFPVFSLYQDNNIQLKNAVSRCMKVASYVMFPIIIGFAAVAESFVSVILTEKWLPAVPYIYVFCAFYIFKPLKTINQSCIKALGKMRTYMLLNCIEKGIGVLLLLISMHLGVMEIAVSAVITYAIAAGMEMIANHVYLSYGFLQQIKDISSPLILSVIMGLLVFAMNELPWNAIAILIMQIMVGALIYIGLSITLKVDTFYYLFKTAKSMIKKRQSR